ncbi:hypothetical protein J1605_023457 [Eschrichtius robustus]|uniref:Ig-like domain-containing protein n=1 Tax=Eschrichtius robustus TaxID=9764 RepID=A0AB34H7W7_ESCRO|nr:hypothetical protein J1605_023457 [Eschrichtius robustus]
MEPGYFDSLANTLLVLKLNRNRISALPPKMFRLPQLQHLELNRNKIKNVDGLTFQGLGALKSLKMQRNGVTKLMDGAFWGLSNMEILQLDHNNLTEITKGWLYGLLMLQELHLSQNAINRISPDAWEFCQKLNDFPKPQITVQPETQSAIKGSNLSFVCSAASSSDSPMTFAWKKDNELLHDAEMENYAHLRAQGGEVMEYTTILRLRSVEFTSEGKYQCVISNHFGSSYSVKAKLTVNMLPSFTKTPMDLTIRAGAMARLECAALGHPAPQIAWQKDGGTDFPAARERRMHVMPEDDVFFIVDVKIEDIGVYSCTAQNSAGSISANATLTVLDRTVTKGETAVLQCIAGGSPPPRLNWTKDDSPLVVTERHFFAAGNQLLIIVDSDVRDAGKYTCEMSNTLGTERGHVRLSVIPTPTCDSPQLTASSLDDDGWATMGIVIIAVVCCVVGTSLVWVVVIYHTRRRNEDCSITNTDETNLPADTPSYLSSQGTLADRQDGYVSSESGSHHQFVTSSGGGFFLPQHGSNGTCHIDNSSEADVEAATDPFLCPFLGPSGPVYLKGSVYGSDPFEAYHTGCGPDPRTALMEHYEPSYIKKKEGYPCPHPSEESCEQSVSDTGWPSHVRKLLSSSYSQHEGPGMNNLCLNKSSADFSPSPEPASVTLSKSFMGTFGKPLRRPHLDAFSSSGQSSDCQPRTFHLKARSSPNLDCESEEDGKERTDFQQENHTCTYKQALENHRISNFPSYDLDT